MSENWETRTVRLWLDNEEGTYRRLVSEAGLEHRAHPEDFDDAAKGLAETIETIVCDEMMPEVEGIYLDLLNASLSEVNWLELAEAILENEFEPEDWEEEEETDEEEEETDD